MQHACSPQLGPPGLLLCSTPASAASALPTTHTIPFPPPPSPPQPTPQAPPARSLCRWPTASPRRTRASTPRVRSCVGGCVCATLCCLHCFAVLQVVWCLPSLRLQPILTRIPPHPRPRLRAAAALEHIIVEGAKHALREGPAHLDFLNVGRRLGREGGAELMVGAAVGPVNRALRPPLLTPTSPAPSLPHCQGVAFFVRTLPPARVEAVRQKIEAAAARHAPQVGCLPQGPARPWPALCLADACALLRCCRRPSPPPISNPTCLPLLCAPRRRATPSGTPTLRCWSCWPGGPPRWACYVCAGCGRRGLGGC